MAKRRKWPPNRGKSSGLLLHPWPQIGRPSFPSLLGRLCLAGLPGKLPMSSPRCPKAPQDPASSSLLESPTQPRKRPIAGAAGTLTSLGRLSDALGTTWGETFWTFPNMAKKRRYQAADFASKPGWIGRAARMHLCNCGLGSFNNRWGEG